MPARKDTLSRDRVMREAIALADQQGIQALSMRKLGQRLGVEAMSLYNHVEDKEDILDGMVDLIITEIDVGADDTDWQTAMRRRAHSVRQLFLRHPWALAVMESRRNPGAESMRYYDSVLGCLRKAGFTIALAAHAFAALDSFIYGFALQELKLPFKTPDQLKQLADSIMHSMQNMPLQQFPHFTEMITQHVLKPGYSFGNEFDYGLNLVLDSLERARQAQ